MSHARIIRAAIPLVMAAFPVLIAPPITAATGQQDSTQIYDAPAQRLSDRTSAVGSRGHARLIPGSAHFLGPDIVPFQDQSFDNVHRLVLRLPGVYASDEDGYGLRPNIGMRGSNPYRSAGLAVMEDGVPVAPAPYAAPGLWVFAGMGRMEAVESLKGPGAIAYGPGTTGGTLNFKTLSPPDDLVAQARLSLGSYSAHTLHLDYGDSRGGLSWMLGTHQTRTDGFKALDTGAETGFEHDDYLVKLRLRSAPEANTFQEVTFKFGYFRHESDDSYLGLTEADFRSTPFRRYAASQKDNMKHNASQLLLQHFIAMNDAVDLTTSVYRNDLDMDWYLLDGVNGVPLDRVLDHPDLFVEEYGILAGDSTSADDALAATAYSRSCFSNGIQSVMGAVLPAGSVRNEIEVGLRYHEDEDDRMNRIDGYRMEDGAMVLTSRGDDGGNGGPDNTLRKAKSFAAFARDRISSGRWTFTPGLRVEWVSIDQTTYAAGDAARTASNATEGSKTVLLPGVGATWRPVDQLLLLAGVHRGLAPPVLDDHQFYDAIHMEVGARTIRQGLNAALVGFRSDIGWPGPAGGDITKTWGVEASAGYEIQNTEYGLALDAAYTFTHPEYEPNGVTVDGWYSSYSPGDEVPYVPEHSLNASITATTRKSHASVVGNYASRVRTIPGSGAFHDADGADARVLLDIVTEYELVSHTRIFASVYNVLDEIYVASRFPYGAHPGAPRTFTAGLKLAF